MNTEANDLLEILLRECAAAGPQPWYPADYVNQTGVSRARIDADLDRLRLGGLLRLTEWVQGKGQGYAVTPEGAEVLQNPRHVQRMRQQGVEPQPAPAPLRSAETRTTVWGRGEAIRGSMLQPSPPVVTFLLISANVLVFFAGTFVAKEGDSGPAGTVYDFLSHLGPLSRGAVVFRNEWWRLLGYAFLHAGFIHLLLNMVSLWFLGRFAEAMFGSGRFLILYVTAALGGGCAVVLSAIGSSHDVPTIGASGGVCGLLTAAAMWVFLNRRHLPSAFVASFFRAFTTNVMLLVFISLAVTNISHMCHLGGALGGAAVAVPLVHSRFGRGWRRGLGLVGSLALPVAFVAAIYFSTTDQERLEHVRLLVLSAERLAKSTYVEHGRPLLNKGNPIKDSKARENQEALSQASERLRSGAERLDRISFSDPQLRKALPIARDYVLAWSEYFQALAKAVNGRDSPAEEDRRELGRLFERTQSLTHDLSDSAFFSDREKQ
jgi:membrane associated rhomboid family serine protease